MTEEEIQALKDAKEAAERRAADAETLANAEKTKAEKAATDLNGVVEELKQQRLKTAEALTKANINNDGVDVNSLIERALQEKELAKQKAEVEQAINEFKASKPEFQADSAGLVFGKFQETLKKFNLGTVTNKEDAKRLLEDVYKFSGLGSQAGGGSNYDGTPSISPAPGSVPNTSEKTVEELVKITGMPQDKVKKLTDKYPDALRGLGS